MSIADAMDISVDGVPQEPPLLYLIARDFLRVITTMEFRTCSAACFDKNAHIYYTVFSWFESIVTKLFRASMLQSNVRSVLKSDWTNSAGSVFKAARKDADLRIQMLEDFACGGEIVGKTKIW